MLNPVDATVRILVACALSLAAGCGGNAEPRSPTATPAAPTPPPTAGKETEMKNPTEPRHETATLAGGCFWCTEAVLERVDGVVSVDSGYMGGTVERPTYDQVCSGATGHAEVVQVVFDPAKLGYRDLLDWFFKAHDPTTLNRQGNDYGTQYRSAIFVHSEEQRQQAEAAKAAAQAHARDPIVTEITTASTFWVAEDYHQDFFKRNPTQGYCNATIPPKLKKLGLDRK